VLIGINIDYSNIVGISAIVRHTMYVTNNDGIVREDIEYIDVTLTMDEGGSIYDLTVNLNGTMLPTFLDLVRTGIELRKMRGQLGWKL